MPRPVSVAPDGAPLYFVTVYDSRAVDLDWWLLRAKADLLNILKRSKPAPAQPHEAELLVGPCVQNLSSHTGSVAIGATHVADSNPQSVNNATGSVAEFDEIVVHGSAE